MGNYQLIEDLVTNFGMTGMMISGSKSGYRDRNPDNLAVFNSNICVFEKDSRAYSNGHGLKIWFGDIDITKGYAKLMELAIEHDIDIYILTEFDGRFENEEKPLMNNFVFKAGKDGIGTLGDIYNRMYKIENNTIIKSKKR